MRSLILQAFTKSLVMTTLSEVGDRTFCIAAILAMRYPRKSVLLGCLVSVVAMTVISALVGWIAPNLISKKWSHHMTTFLFFAFGIQSLYQGFTEDDDDNEELAEVEKELENDLKASSAKSKAASSSKENDSKSCSTKSKDASASEDDDGDSKKKRRPFIYSFVSPVFLKAFSLTFFGEWGDKSQLATIGLAADEDTLGVVLGGIVGQMLCTIAAVIGGKSLASRVSERLVTLLGGFLFLIFGVQSILSPME